MASGRRAGLDVTEEEAIRWVTMNPAWALGIDHRVGSLEPGKDARRGALEQDPFSVYAVAEKVWIDGALVYERGMPHWSDFELGQDRLRRAALPEATVQNAGRQPGERSRAVSGPRPRGRGSRCTACAALAALALAGGSARRQPKPARPKPERRRRRGPAVAYTGATVHLGTGEVVGRRHRRGRARRRSWPSARASTAPAGRER